MVSEMICPIKQKALPTPLMLCVLPKNPQEQTFEVKGRLHFGDGDGLERTRRVARKSHHTGGNRTHGLGRNQGEVVGMK